MAKCYICLKITTIKKYLPYIIVLLALLGGVGYFMYEYSPTTMEQREMDFGVHNIDRVTRIDLSDVKGTKLTLTKQGKRWLVNGKYDVNDEAMVLLLIALEKVETQYIVPANAQPNVAKDMARQHSKCDIYLDGNDKPSKTYYVGGPTLDGKGTYMVMEIEGKPAVRPYVTHIDGVYAYLTSRYVPNEDRWRTRWIYHDNSQTIQSLKVEYQLEKQKSFIINRVAKDSFVLAGSDGSLATQPKQKFIQQYLDFYSEISLEAFENTNPIKDSVLSGEPFCKVNLKRIDGTETNAILYYVPLNEKSMVRFDDDGRPLRYDIEHYYAVLNGGKDFVLVQYYMWGKVLRSYDEFTKKPTSQSK